MNYYVNLLIVECCYFLPNLIFFGIDYERFTDLASTRRSRVLRKRVRINPIEHEKAML